VRELTKGGGAQAVVETAGTVKALVDACLSVARGGTVSLLGIPQEDAALPMKQIVLNEVELVGNRANPNCAPDAIQLVAEGRVSLGDMLTHEFPIKDFQRAFEVFMKRLENSVKVAIHPNL